MNQTAYSPIPDSAMLGSEVELGDQWDPAVVSRLIRSKSTLGETPAFLFLGKKEADLLKEHLAEVFGSESVSTLRTTYYMGLQVVELASPSFVFAGGRKTTRVLQDPISRRPAWRDRETESLWHLRL
jgi:hypothetical protein